METRPATDADVAAIRACARAAYARYIPRIGREPAPMVANFEALVAAGKVRVIAEGAEVLGFVVYYPRGDHLHLENVAVRPGRQGERLGSWLVRLVEEEARRRGLAAVELYTNLHMTENLRLYPALGYVETGRRREDGFERVYFRKDL